MNWYNEAVLDEPVALTLDAFRKIMPDCRQPALWWELLDLGMSREGVVDLSEIALMLAHFGHESLDLNRLVESFNYTPEALMSVFGSRRIEERQAQALGRTETQRAQQEALANVLYGGAWGAKHLGNVCAGDGWKYRGRGIIQLTGRDNYSRCGDELGLPLVSQPELLAESPQAAVEAALWFWRTHVPGRDLKSSTRQINPGLAGLEDRGARYRVAMRVLSI